MQSSCQSLLVIEQPDPSLFEQQKRAEEFEKIQMIEQRKIQAQLEAQEREARARASGVVTSGVEAIDKKAYDFISSSSTAEKKIHNATIADGSAQVAGIPSGNTPYSSVYRSSAYTSAQTQTTGAYGSRFGTTVAPQKPQKPIAQKVTETVFGALGEGVAEIRMERTGFSHPHGKRIYSMSTMGNGPIARLKRSVSTNPRKEKAFYSSVLLALKTTKTLLAFGLPVAAKSIFGKR
jgi:hypothetical protein